MYSHLYKYALIVVGFALVIWVLQTPESTQTVNVPAQDVSTMSETDTKVEHPFYAKLQESHQRMMNMDDSMMDMDHSMMDMKEDKRTIAVLLYDGFNLLDASGPIESLNMLGEDYEVVTVAKEKGEVSVENGLKMLAQYSFEEMTEPDVLIIPGGMMGTLAVTKDEETLEWIRNVDTHTTYTTSVCTGSWILAAAGLLEGKEASTHWTGADYLEQLGATYTGKRYTETGKYITAAGVTGGIDMGIVLTSKLAGDDDAGKMSELIMEYDPQPPFGSGTPQKADAELVDIILKMNQDHIGMVEGM